MIFHSGAKLRRFKFTVRPQSTIIVHGQAGPVTQQVKPLRAIFKYGNEHTFDSILAQLEYDWTEDERILVERALSNPSNGYLNKRDGRGIWPDVPVEQQAERDQAGDIVVCKAMNVADGQPMPCDKPAIPGSLYCDAHVLESVSAPTIDTCSADVDGELCGAPLMEGSDYCAEHTEAVSPEEPVASTTT